MKKLIFLTALCGIAAILCCGDSTTPPETVDGHDIILGDTSAVHLGTVGVLGGIVEVWARNSFWDRGQRLLTLDIYLVNRSDVAINTPVFLVVLKLIPSDVGFVNPDGQTENDLPYMLFDDEFGPDSLLAPGETSGSVGCVFDTHEHDSFSIQVDVIDVVNPNGVISGVVFRDADQDGFYDDEEGGLQGLNVTARYLKSSGERDSVSTQTDRGGRFYFSELSAGAYTLHVEAPPGAVATTGEQLLVELIRLFDGTVPAFHSADFGIYTEPRSPNAVPVLTAEWEADAYSMAIDRFGYLHLTNPFRGSVFKHLPTGELVDTWNLVENSYASWPMYMEFKNRHFYFVSGTPKPSRIAVFDESREFSRFWLEKYSHQGYAGGIDGIAVDDDGFVYTLEFDGEAVVKYAPDGSYEREWSTHGIDPGRYNRPGGIVVGPNDVVYVSDTENNRILMFSRDGEFIGQFSGSGGVTWGFRWPTGLAIGEDQILYVVDRVNKRIQKLTLSGSYLAEFVSGVGSTSPLIMAVKGRDIFVLLEDDVIQYFHYSD